MLMARDMWKIANMIACCCELDTASRRLRTLSLGLAAALGLVACGPATPTQGINDHYEAQNRQVHKFNVGIDKNIIRPLARSTGIIPEPVKQGVSNFSDNLDLPGAVVNNLLQFRLGQAAENTLRFGINTTIGIGGLFDPATAAGVKGKDTDFGETLYVWGATEGNYLELPFMGPSTERDALGKVVDYALNPLRLIRPKTQHSRDRQNRIKTCRPGPLSETVDSVLYESADSYAQTRLLYLDNRRFNLGQAPSRKFVEDPYAQ